MSKLLICDESVSVLDVSVQAEILNLLKDLQAGFGVVYISHNVAAVGYMADRIMCVGHSAARGTVPASSTSLHSRFACCHAPHRPEE
ncbi:MAG: hypothetical protein ACE5K1_05270 [Acidiferrobacterales bacterium]